MKKLAILLCAVLLCQSCAVLPAEERSFVVTLCIGKEDGQFVLAARVSGYHQPGDYLTIEAKGETLTKALASLDAASPMRLHYGQVRMVILCRKPDTLGALTPILNELSDIPEFRTDAVLCVSQEKPKSVSDAMNPLTGTRLSKSIDVLLESRVEQGVIISQTIGQILRMGNRQSPTAMRIQINKAEKPDDKDTIKLEGAWLIDQNGFVRTSLDAGETQILSLLMGQLKKGEVILDKASITVVQASSKLGVDQGIAAMTLNIRHGNVAQRDETIRLYMEQAAGSVLEKLAQSNCDALGLARCVIRQCKTESDWDVLNWRELYPCLQWKVSVKATGTAGD